MQKTERTRPLDVVVRTRDGDKLVDQALLDVQDWFKLKKHRWTMGANGRILRSVPQFNGQPILQIGLGQDIIGIKPGMVIKHINGDLLDFRRCNLTHVPQGSEEHRAPSKLPEGFSTKKETVKPAFDYGERRAQVGWRHMYDACDYDQEETRPHEPV